MKDFVEKLVWPIVVLALIWILQGCATVEGIGRDLQAASQATRTYMETE